MWFMFVIPFIMFFVIFFAVVVSMFRGHNKSIDTMQTMVKDVAKKNASIFFGQTDNTANEDKVCEYCGSKIGVNESKCSACGARVSDANKK